MKLKICKICQIEFMPKKFNQKVCSINCAIIESKTRLQENKSKEIRKKNKEIKQTLKTKGDHLKELQTIFNKFIRLRDKDQPCISCGTTNPVKYDAGHFYSVGAYPNLRFNEDNVHKQCSNYCNVQHSGNFAEYSINLPERIGINRYNQLLHKRKEPLKLSIFEIEEMKVIYRNKIKELE